MCLSVDDSIHISLAPKVLFLSQTIPSNLTAMNSLPENWRDEHDHFIVYMRNSPTVLLRFTSLEHIWQNIQDTFPYLGLVDYGAFCRREQQLQGGAMQMLMDIWNLMYWWTHNHPWNPFMDNWDTHAIDISHTASPPLDISFDVMAKQTIKQTRDALWDAEPLSADGTAGVAVGATVLESHTGPSTTGKATTANNRQPRHQGDIDFTEPSSEDEEDRILRKVLEEDLGTMKGRRRLGLLKRGEDGQKVT